MSDPGARVSPGCEQEGCWPEHRVWSVSLARSRGRGEREWLQSTSLDSVPGHSSSPSLCSGATKTEITQAFYQTLTRINEDKRLLKTFIDLQ